MTEKFSGKFLLTVEEGTEGGMPWQGNITVPDDISQTISFELHSNNPAFSRSPFQEIGAHSSSVVRAWIDYNRPITLIEPYTLHSGNGAWAKGYRSSATIRGEVTHMIHDEHLRGGQAEEILEVGFCSDSLSLLCGAQKDFDGATKLPNNRIESSAINSRVDLHGLGRLHFNVRLKNDQDEKATFSRAFTRLSADTPLTIAQVLKYCRFHVAVLDFLSGKPAGSFFCSILATRERDSTLQMGSKKRHKADVKIAQSRTHLDQPSTLLPDLISMAWHDEHIKERIFAATTIAAADFGLMEKFTRTSAYLEQWLRNRYADDALKSRQADYKKGIEEYREYIRLGGANIADFSTRFARPAYPKSETLRELLELAIAECQPLGLCVPEKYEKEMVRLRNEVFHGQEGSSSSWIKRIQMATEVAVALLELLTAKDLGLEPTKNYLPRHDLLGPQLGIYG